MKVFDHFQCISMTTWSGIRQFSSTLQDIEGICDQRWGYIVCKEVNAAVVQNAPLPSSAYAFVFVLVSPGIWTASDMLHFLLNMLYSIYKIE